MVLHFATKHIKYVSVHTPTYNCILIHKPRGYGKIMIFLSHF